jgi:hypothetical protein
VPDKNVADFNPGQGIRLEGHDRVDFAFRRDDCVSRRRDIMAGALAGRVPPHTTGYRRGAPADRSSACGNNGMAASIGFTMAVDPGSDAVGAGAGIVYGRREATQPAVSTDAPLYGCSRVPT